MAQPTDPFGLAQLERQQVADLVAFALRLTASIDSLLGAEQHLCNGEHFEQMKQVAGMLLARLSDQILDPAEKAYPGVLPPAWRVP
jgi:hypothetical protein